MKHIFLSFFALCIPFCGKLFAEISAASPYSIEGYWESWNPKDDPEEIAQMPVDIIHIAFGTVVSSSEDRTQILLPLCREEAVKRLVKKAHSLGKNVTTSLNGFSLINEEQVENISQSLVKYVRKFQLNGVDLNITDYPVKPNLHIALIQSLRKNLGPVSHLSYSAKAIAAIPSPCDQILKAAHPFLTSIQPLCYNLGEAYQFQGTIEHLIAIGIPREKIVIGLMPGTDLTGRWTTLIDFEKAASYVRYHSLKGICIWSLNQDLQNFTLLGCSGVTNLLYSLLPKF